MMNTKKAALPIHSQLNSTWNNSAKKPFKGRSFSVRWFLFNRWRNAPHTVCQKINRWKEESFSVHWFLFNIWRNSPHSVHRSAINGFFHLTFLPLSVNQISTDEGKEALPSVDLYLTKRWTRYQRMEAKKFHIRQYLCNRWTNLPPISDVALYVALEAPICGDNLHPPYPLKAAALLANAAIS